MPKLFDLFGSVSGVQPVLPESGFLTEDQVLSIFPFSKSTLRNLVLASKFPPPVKISSGRLKAWAAEDLRAEYERLRKTSRTPA